MYNQVPQVHYESADDIIGGGWLRNLSVLALTAVGGTAVVSMLKNNPRALLGMVKGSREIKKMELAKDLKDSLRIVRYEMDSVGAKRDFRIVSKQTMQQKYKATKDAITVENILHDTRQSNKSKEYFLHLPKGKSPVRIDADSVKTIKDAFESGLVTKTTSIDNLIFQHNNEIKNLRALDVRAVAQSKLETFKKFKVPFLGIGPADLSFSDFWAERPTFVMSGLSEAGNTKLLSKITGKPLFVNNALYDVTDNGLNLVSSNARLGFAEGNIGFSYSVISGAYDNALFGQKAIGSHPLFKKISDTDEFTDLYSILQSQQKEHGKINLRNLKLFSSADLEKYTFDGSHTDLFSLAETAWENKYESAIDPLLAGILRLRKQALNKAANSKNIGGKILNNYLKDFHPMYARQGSVFNAFYDTLKVKQNKGITGILLDEEGFKQLNYLEQTTDLIGAYAFGIESEHIKFVNDSYKLASKTATKNKTYLHIKDYLHKQQHLGFPTTSVWGTHRRQAASLTVEEWDKIRRTGDVPSMTQKNKYFTYDPKEISNARLVGHYMTERINRLYEAVTGMGIKPSPNILNQFGRQITHVALPVMGAVWGASLLNDMMGAASGGVLEPKTLGAQALAGTMLAKQYAFNKSGISAIAGHMEQVAPGSTNSTLAELSSMIGGTYLGHKLGRRFGKGKLGAIVGGLLGLGFAFGDPAKPTEELLDEMAGRKWVPVRKNRGWVLGRQDFKGDQIKYFKPHWYQMITKDLATKARYGGNFNKWMHGTLPGKIANIGLRPLKPFFGDSGIGNPYYLEEKGPWKHSYPISNPLLQDIPFIGPMLEWGVGSALKPYHYYSPTGQNWKAPFKYDESGLTPDEISALGITNLTQKRSIPQNPHSFLAQVGNTMHSLEQYSGLYGWAIGSLLGQFNQGELVESFSSLYSASHAYYSTELGGLLGFSEYLRRFVPKTPGKLVQYNPLPAQNISSEFPGSKSRYAHERSYPIDMFYGGPTKLPMGELRLPGPVMDELFQTDLDEVDKYLMMSYAIPGSQAYKDSRRLTKILIRSGAIDVKVARQLGWAEWSTSEKLKRLPFDYREYTSSLNDSDMAYVNQANQVFSDETIATVGMQGKALAAINSYNKAVKGEQRPGRFEVPVLDKMVGAAWETVTHTDFPVPFLGSILSRKLIHNRTPLEEYEYTRIYSDSFASWDKPFKTGIVDVMYNIGDYLGFDVPNYKVDDESAIIQYTDALKYDKFRRLENRAKMVGRQDIAKKMEQKARETIVGADYSDPFKLMQSAYRAMPTPDKAFLKDFMFAPPSDREGIFNEASPHMRALLMKAWNLGGAQTYGQIKFTADMEAKNIINKYQPRFKSPSLIYHPSYDIARERIRLSRREGIDIHRLGLWEQQEIVYNNGVMLN